MNDLKRFFLAVFVGLAVWGCFDTGVIEKDKGLTSLKVTILSETGSVDAPLDGSQEIPVEFRVEALDEEGDPIEDYQGRLHLKALNGFLSRTGEVDVDAANGDELTVPLMRGFNQVRLYAEDLDELVVGVSEPIYLPKPTLATLQTPAGDIEASAWDKHFMHVEDGLMVVTHATLSGFFATDVLDEEFNHIYVYTHNVPYVDRGDVVSFVSGTISEFFGLTELSFPDYGIACNHYPLPEPVELSPNQLADKDFMEKLEGGLVAVNNMKVNFVTEKTFFTYGQWTGKIGGAAIVVLSREALPTFNPLEERGVTFTRMVGNLRHHWSADSGVPKPNSEYIIVPRDACDVWGYGERPEYCDEEAPATNCSFD